MNVELLYPKSDTRLRNKGACSNMRTTYSQRIYFTKKYTIGVNFWVLYLATEMIMNNNIHTKNSQKNNLPQLP